MVEIVPKKERAVHVKCHVTINGKGTADEIKFGSLVEKRFG